MHPPSNDQPRRIVLRGAGATIAITALGVVVVGLVSLGRCGFLGDGSVPGTLSQTLCRNGTGRVMFALCVGVPAIVGFGGTWRAALAGDRRLLNLPLMAAAAVPAVIALLYLASASL